MNAIPAARSDILALRSYRAGAQVADTIRLNANEAPFAPGSSRLNRYPEVRPSVLQRQLARVLDVPDNGLLVTRGSSEAIDVLIRAWCRAYSDKMLITPPTFEMYRVYAEIQGAGVLEAPLGEDDFSLDVDRVLATCDAGTKLVFVCSPNNPTGTLVAADDILRLARERRGQSLIVVDEAYIEFSGSASLSGAIADNPNVVVLRTLSKAHGLAGARCGLAIADPKVIDVMNKVLPPYSFPTPVIETVSLALTDDVKNVSSSEVAALVEERRRVKQRLDGLACVTRTWPSAANFILTRFDDLAAVVDHVSGRQILIRDFGDVPALENCARITIGARDENDALLDALAQFEGAAGG